MSSSQQMLENFPRMPKESGGYGTTFLAYAAERGFEKHVKLAISHSSETIDEPDHQGRTPFSLAAQGTRNHTGRLEAMKALYAAHINPNTADLHGKTPLHYAVMIPSNDEITRFLASIPELNLDQKDNYEFTALGFAVHENRKGYVELLLAAGADPMSVLPDGSTMLILCVKMGYLSIFRAIIYSGRCEPDVPDSDGRTALSWCASVCDEVAARMMSILLRLETVNANSRDNDGQTPLERAIRGAQPTMVNMLCSRVEFLDVTNAKGASLLQLVFTLCRMQNCVQFHDITILLLASGHVKPYARKFLRDSVWPACKSRGLDKMAGMIETFLEGGDLGPPLTVYPELVES